MNSKLKSMNYFKGLGSYYDKIQRMRKLGGMISDELLISKEKVELSASISKVDLLSELVGEFPELQGIMGGYFANVQGFDKELSLAVSEQYLPVGSGTKIPKKPYSIALSLADKIDTLVGFFGVNQKPTSSKDPFALRRLALGIVRIIIENKKDFKIRDLINYSSSLYQDQGFEFENKSLQKELLDFLLERLKYYMKEENIRNDIIQASISSFNLDQSVIIFNKAKNESTGYKPYAEQIAQIYRGNLNVLEEVINILFYIAEADGNISQAELVMIEDIGRIFGLSESQFNSLKESRKSSDKLNPYIVLESNPDDSLTEIRKRYIKLSKEHHPDLLLSKGVPPEVIEESKKKMRSINSAWDQVQKLKN